jgi:hypothetical protein
VADIVQNRYGTSIPGVDSARLFEQTIEQVRNMHHGFVCLNIQETVLAGYANRYADRLLVSDRHLVKLMAELTEDIQLFWRPPRSKEHSSNFVLEVSIFSFKGYLPTETVILQYSGEALTSPRPQKTRLVEVVLITSSHKKSEGFPSPQHP